MKKNNNNILIGCDYTARVVLFSYIAKKKVKVHPYSLGERWAGSCSPSKAMQPTGVQST